VSTAPHWSFIWPVYNEATVLRDSWNRLVQAADQLGVSWECIAVDDGSRDGSGALLTEIADRDAHMRPLLKTVNQGKGAALRDGVQTARGRQLVTMDVDLSTDLEALPRTAALFGEGLSFIYGDRRHPDSELLVRQPRLRETLGTGFAWLARVLCTPGIRDGTCGFKAFESEVGRALFQRIEADGWAHDVELFVAADALGIVPTPLPVRWSHSPGSKVRLPGAIIEAGADLWRIRQRRASGAFR